MPESLAKGCSLADLVTRMNAPIIFASGPEYGARRAKEGGTTGDFDVPCMVICEHIPSKLKGGASFTFAVDYKGSVASGFTSSRCHAVVGAEAVLANMDFEESRGKEILSTKGKKPEALEKKLATCTPELKIAIENSFWVAFWRGQVTGALTTALQNAAAIPNSMDAIQEGIMITRGGVFHGIAKAKAAICLTVDGGAITQVEKTLIPSIGKSVLCNLRMRGLRSDTDCQVIWCHFPTIEDVLRSLDGVKNLQPDLDNDHIIALNAVQSPDRPDLPFLITPTTFKCVSRLNERVESDSILEGTVADFMEAEMDMVGKVWKMLSARDDAGVLFILERIPDASKDLLGKILERSLAEVMSVDVIQKLIELGAWSEMSLDDKLEALKESTSWVESEHAKHPEADLFFIEAKKGVQEIKKYFESM